MFNYFQALIAHLAGAASEPFSEIDLVAQFCPDKEGHEAICRNLNAAFGLALAGNEDALEYLNSNSDDQHFGQAVAFYIRGLELIKGEIEELAQVDTNFGPALQDAARLAGSCSNRQDAIEGIRRVLFPEGLGISERRSEMIEELRCKRRVTIGRLNPSPIENPAREMIFTSNVLLTVPLRPDELDGLDLSEGLREKVRSVLGEDQLYWYDHPIPLGVPTESNEALYGIRGLDRAVAFEKKRGTLQDEDRVSCVLSVSCTHEGLQGLAKDYLEEVFKVEADVRHLDLYVFTEADTRRLLDNVLEPAAKHFLGVENIDSLRAVFGVDGEYGRHYSFLKAIAALWQVLVDDGIRGTFKIDLDQIFPQEQLVEQGGMSAFEYFRSTLWGAEGTDSSGCPVELGMIAGALVNERDIGEGIFTPDVCFPPKEVKGEHLVFQSGLPQALSTQAEMMARYDDDGIDGKAACIERIHVTGGTNGILVKSLRRHRPFTPVFIGRAEDQAYIMSRLFTGERYLRYFHAPGLIMRHDKEAFASEAMKAAAAGKLVGDYARILWFSHYARALPWPAEHSKTLLDPFTGCFVSRMPYTVVYLRLLFQGAELFASGSDVQGAAFLEMGTSRLSKLVDYLATPMNPLVEEYSKECEAWELYYDVLDRLESALKNGNELALEFQAITLTIVQSVQLKVG